VGCRSNKANIEELIVREPGTLIYSDQGVELTLQDGSIIMTSKASYITPNTAARLKTKDING